MARSRNSVPLPSPADWFGPWMQVCEIACTAPLVIGYRSMRILTGGWPPSARDRREITRMWQEKAEALTAAAVATMTTVPGPVAASRVLRPIQRGVRGNGRRLSRG